MRPMTSQDTIDAIIEELGDRLVECKLSRVVAIDISLDGRTIILDRIESFERGKGHADRALKVLIELCNECQRDLTLIVRPLNAETSERRLEEWYLTNGFIRCGGKLNTNEMRRTFR